MGRARYFGLAGALTTVWAVCLMLLSSPALAGGPDFQAAQSEAYAHYREAAFYTRTENIPVAALALDEFVSKWSALVRRYADDPPPAYASDPRWKATLQEILARARTGLDSLDAGEPEAAAEAIGPIRAMLGDLRHRNNVASFSDTVDALSAAMDVLARYRKDVRNIKDPATVKKIGKQADVVEALFEKCRDEAGPEMSDDPEFKRLISGAAESMAKVRNSLKTGNLRLFRIGSGELRSYERIMFLRFG
jgi:hypothetical protein